MLGKPMLLNSDPRNIYPRCYLTYNGAQLLSTACQGLYKGHSISGVIAQPYLLVSLTNSGCESAAEQVFRKNRDAFRSASIFTSSRIPCLGSRYPFPQSIIAQEILLELQYLMQFIIYIYTFIHMNKLQMQSYKHKI